MTLTHRQRQTLLRRATDLARQRLGLGSSYAIDVLERTSKVVLDARPTTHDACYAPDDDLSDWVSLSRYAHEIETGELIHLQFWTRGEHAQPVSCAIVWVGTLEIDPELVEVDGYFRA